MSEQDILLMLVERLDPIEVRLLCLRYGIGNEKKHTLEQTAKAMKLTRERIRQREAAARQKLANQGELHELDAYILTH